MKLKGLSLPKISYDVFKSLPLLKMNEKEIHGNLLYRLTDYLQVSEDGIIHCICFMLVMPEREINQIVYEVELDVNFFF